MKKSLFLSLFIASTLLLKAQNTVSVLSADFENKTYYYTFRMHPVETDNDNKDENQYIYRNSNFNKLGMFGIPKKLYYDYIYTIDKNAQISVSTPIEIPTNYIYYKSFEKDNNIIAVYSYETMKTTEIYINIYDKKNPIWHPKQLIAFNHEHHDFRFRICVSPDNNKICVFSMLTNKKSMLENMEASLFDLAGDKIWKNSIKPDFEGQTFRIHDVAISNNETVYLATSAFTGDDDKKTDTKVYIFEISDNNFQKVEASQEIGNINDAKFLILKNGNIFVGGYFSDIKRNDDIKGSFSIIYNSKTKSIDNFSFREFPSDIRKDNNQYLRIDELMELSNGTIVSLGDPKIETIYQTQYSNKYYYSALGIFYTSFASNGEIENYKIFRKNQSNSLYFHVSDFKSLGLSYYAFEKDGVLCLLYNDNVENLKLPSNPDDVEDVYPFKFKENILHLVEIKGDDVSSKVIINGKTQKMAMVSMIYANSDHLIIVGVSKTVDIDKIALE